MTSNIITRITEIQQVDKNQLEVNHMILWKSIVRFKDIHEFPKTSHSDIISYLIQDIVAYDKFCRKLQDFYPRSQYRLVALFSAGENHPISAVYLPFKEGLIL